MIEAIIYLLAIAMVARNPVSKGGGIETYLIHQNALGLFKRLKRISKQLIVGQIAPMHRSAMTLASAQTQHVAFLPSDLKSQAATHHTLPRGTSLGYYGQHRVAIRPNGGCLLPWFSGYEKGKKSRTTKFGLTSEERNHMQCKL